MNSLTVDEFRQLNHHQRGLVLDWLAVHALNPDNTVALDWGSGTLVATQLAMRAGKPILDKDGPRTKKRAVTLRAPFPPITTDQENA